MVGTVEGAGGRIVDNADRAVGDEDRMQMGIATTMRKTGTAT
jgi:hypothetical protein